MKKQLDGVVYLQPKVMQTLNVFCVFVITMVMEYLKVMKKQLDGVASQLNKIMRWLNIF